MVEEPAGVGRGRSPACCFERQFSIIVKNVGFHVGILDRVESQVLALTLTCSVILEKLLDPFEPQFLLLSNGIMTEAAFLRHLSYRMLPVSTAECVIHKGGYPTY